MASKRMIQTDTLKQKWWGKLSLLARVLFDGLIKIADDQGRCVGHLPIVRSQVFPWDDLSLKEIGAAVEELAQVGQVQCYAIGDDEYIQLLTWWDHQQMQYARPSEYPAPEGWTDRIRYNLNGKYVESNWGTNKDETPNSPPPPPPPAQMALPETHLAPPPPTEPALPETTACAATHVDVLPRTVYLDALPRPPYLDVLPRTVYLDALGRRSTYTSYLDPLKLRLNQGINQINLKQTRPSSSSLEVLDPRARASGTKNQEEEEEGSKSSHQKPKSQPSKKLPPEISRMLEDANVFPHLWGEVSDALMDGYTQEDLTALMEWVREDNPSAPGGLFMARLRMGARAPICAECGGVGKNHRDGCARIVRIVTTTNYAFDDADLPEPEEEIILPVNLENALKTALSDLKLERRFTRILNWLPDHSLLELTFEPFPYHPPVGIDTRPGWGNGDSLESALKKRIVQHYGNLTLLVRSPGESAGLEITVSPDILAKWQVVLARASSQMPKASFQTWLADTLPTAYSDRKLTIGARNSFAVDWLTEKAAETINQILPSIFGESVTVKFEVA